MSEAPIAAATLRHLHSEVAGAKLGTPGNDRLLGGDDEDWLRGLAGDDRLFGSGDDDRLSGDGGCSTG